MSTDSMILGLRDAGRLKADRQTGRVWYRLPAWTVWREKHPSWNPEKGRYRFHFQIGRHKTVVSRSRVLYLLLNRDAPEVVDHRNGDRTDDHPDNLGPHNRAESDRQGRDFQLARMGELVGNWFDFIARYGYDPGFLPEIPL